MPDHGPHLTVLVSLQYHYSANHLEVDMLKFGSDPCSITSHASHIVLCPTSDRSITDFLPLLDVVRILESPILFSSVTLPDRN